VQQFGFGCAEKWNVFDFSRIVNCETLIVVQLKTSAICRLRR
jgi:hypothetical protein